jgi:mRNA interferase MazF
VNRGDVYDAPVPGGAHPAVVVTRDRAIPVLRNVCVVVVTSRIRGLPTEVPLGPAHGLARECVANADNVFTLPRRALGPRRGSLGPEELSMLDDALRIALGLD